MNPEWLAELDRLADEVRSAVEALLAHSGADGTRLELLRDGTDVPTLIVIGQEDSIAGLAAQSNGAAWDGGDVSDELLERLPDPVREDVEMLRAEHAISRKVKH